MRDCLNAACVQCVHTCPTHAVSSRKLRQVGLILLQVVQAVDVLYVNLELPEVFSQYARTGMQDAPQVRFSQLLPLMQCHRA